jgi:Leucine-rich repeat (LRR) protein
VQQLPALQQLVLQYDSAEYAADTAAAWQQLPQLQELTVEYRRDYPSREWLEAILAGVAAATSLTKLNLEAVILEVTSEEEDLGDGLIADHRVERYDPAACGSLTGVTRLKDLCISENSCLVPGDALALTALTGSTRLVLDGLFDAVGDAVATALACSLRQLRHLDLRACELSSFECLAAVGQLTGLTELHLNSNSAVTEQQLMLLTGLSQLQQLRFDRSKQVTQEAMWKFWSQCGSSRL